MLGQVENASRWSAFSPDSDEVVHDDDVWNPLSSIPTWEDDEGATLDLDMFKTIGEDAADKVTLFDCIEPLTTSYEVVGEEVGDDRVDVSRSSSKLSLGLTVQERVVGMKTSKEDTFISDRMWNFCEVTSSVPADPTGSYDYARRVSNFSNLEFTDTIVLRIIIDCSKGDRSHSSTPVGKMTMLGNKVSTPRSENRLPWMIASYMQDGMLRTSHATDPKYLPQIMGGCGVRALYDRPLNLYLSVRAYRGGGYDRLYGTSARELQECITRLERGESFTPILSLRLRDRQEYLHGTYAEKVFVPERDYLSSFRGNLPTPLYTASGGQNRFTAHENRLIRTRHVLQRPDAELEYDRTIRIRDALLGPWDSVQSADTHYALERGRARREFGMALNANSAFKNLLDRDATIKDVHSLLKDAHFKHVNVGVVEFSILDANWIFNGAKGDVYSIEDLTSSEDIFLREEVSVEETLKVGNLTLHPIIGPVRKDIRTSSKVGLYQINQSMEQWAEGLANRITAERDRQGGPVDHLSLLRIFEEDPEWVNDDTLLIQMCLRDTANFAKASCAVLLVSNDNRLGNQMANTCNVTVYRIGSLDYVLYCTNRGMDPQARQVDPKDLTHLLKLRTSQRGSIRFVYIDTGSVASACAELVPSDDRPQNVMRRIPLHSGIEDGRRYCRYVLHETTTPIAVKPRIHDPAQQPRRV